MAISVDHDVKIPRGETQCKLGEGSFGAVYRASYCGETCAAKILHPTFFQTNDPGESMIASRFERECEILKSVAHPNIVQFLHVTQDPETKLTVLLMELLRQNLTKLLETYPTPLPLHVVVNISCDVANALAYLHWKGFVHRDLSSNNVLLNQRGDAKVADFGMSKLGNSTSTTPLTHCPGTVVYMPPEVFREPPDYNEKIDCFSFGPLLIQMITRKFPNPSPRTVEVKDPTSPTGMAEHPVLEWERRKNHIDMIDVTHPLLPIAKSCLENDPKKRPVAQELFYKLIELKQSEGYTESKLTGKPAIIAWNVGEKIPCDSMYYGSAAVQGDTVYVQPHRSKKIYAVLFNDNIQSWTELPDCHKADCALLIVDEELIAIGGCCESEVFDSLTTFKANGDPQWEEKLPRMPTKRSRVAAAYTQHLIVVAGGFGEGHPLDVIEILDTTTQTWFCACRLPCMLYGHSALVCQDRLYVLGGFDHHRKTTSAYSCSLQSLYLHSKHAATPISQIEDEDVALWQTSAALPMCFSTCISVNGKLIAFGGVGSTKETTRNVYQYNDTSDEWDIVSMMKIARAFCLVAFVANRILVVGGKDGTDPVDCIEYAQIYH